MKVLVFTSSYNRPSMLRQCMLGIKNQSYKNLVHSVNCVGSKETLYPLVDDLLTDKVIFEDLNKNDLIHYNHLRAIRNVPNYKDYDVFVKVDDDDFYKKDYVKNIVKTFTKNPEVDVVSTKIIYQLNGNKLIGNIMLHDNLGGNPGGTDYCMPMTFAFNRRALDVLESITSIEVSHNNDDLAWRYKWADAKIVHQEVDNCEEVIWHVHGKNTSTGSFLRTDPVPIQVKPSKFKKLLNWLGL